MPDSQSTARLMPGSLPKAPAVPAGRAEAEPPKFAQSGLGGLPFTPPGKTPGRGGPSGQPASPFGKYTGPTGPASFPEPDLNEDLTDPSGLDPDTVSDEELTAEIDEPLEQRPYEELPASFGTFRAPDTPQPAPQARNRYEPLPPSAELIEVLPRMLPSTRGLTSTADAPFNAMPETMPPPPLRPVLPPELQPEFDDRRGLVARLFGGSK
jgi:hypothetical protein